MKILIVIVALLLGVAAAFLLYRRKQENSRHKALKAAGMAVDEDGNINAGLSYAAMLARENISGVKLDGAAAQFMQLLRLISEGPESVDEIRFLIENGFEPVVRPDGLVYVPCAENEHLSMPGEIPLEPEDLTVLEVQAITG
ncbi:MAG: DUF4381 domain-containing protein [Woeseiaceae bacterium]|nr:DUF4381 domain-containing protein [Woeseiaceae bacterium]